MKYLVFTHLRFYMRLFQCRPNLFVRMLIEGIQVVSENTKWHHYLKYARNYVSFHIEANLSVPWNKTGS